MRSDRTVPGNTEGLDRVWKPVSGHYSTFFLFGKSSGIRHYSEIWPVYKKAIIDWTIAAEWYKIFLFLRKNNTLLPRKTVCLTPARQPHGGFI